MSIRSRLILAGIVAVFLLGTAVTMGRLSVAREKAAEQKQRALAIDQAARAQKRFDAMTPEKHLEVALSLFKRGDGGDAARHVNVLPPDLKAKYEAETKRINAAAAKALAGMLKLGRQDYARTLENSYLDRGMNITVTTRGVEADVLHLKWALASRVTAHALGKNDQLWKDVRRLRFKKVILANGFSYSPESYSWTLDD